MTTTQAAAIIGCTVSRVRQLCRAGEQNPKLIKQGRAIKAKRVSHGTRDRFEISQREAERFRDLKPPTNKGFPRGKKRKPRSG